VFPIRGHSFLPVDRVFGRIEQQVRKKDTILMPEEYYQLLRSHGNVHVYGQDWEAYDFKTETQAFVKSQKSFKLSEARMLEFRKEKLGFKAVYSGEYCYHSVLKRGKKWANFKPSQLPKESTVKEAKRKDVLNLLSAIGVSDNVHAFYDDALSQSQMNEVDCASLLRVAIPLLMNDKLLNVLHRNIVILIKWIYSMHKTCANQFSIFFTVLYTDIVI